MYFLIAATICGSMLAEEARTDLEVCGLNSFYLVAKFLDRDKDLAPLDRLLPVEKAPYSMADIAGAARTLGFDARARHFTKRTEVEFSSPAILHIKIKEDAAQPDHFLACFGETNEGLIVAELPQGPFAMPRHRLLEVWDGDVLYLSNRTNHLDPKLLASGLLALLIAAVLMPRAKSLARNRGGSRGA